MEEGSEGFYGDAPDGSGLTGWDGMEYEEPAVQDVPKSMLDLAPIHYQLHAELYADTDNIKIVPTAEQRPCKIRDAINGMALGGVPPGAAAGLQNALRIINDPAVFQYMTTCSGTDVISHTRLTGSKRQQTGTIVGLNYTQKPWMATNIATATTERRRPGGQISIIRTGDLMHERITLRELQERAVGSMPSLKIAGVLDNIMQASVGLMRVPSLWSSRGIAPSVGSKVLTRGPRGDKLMAVAVIAEATLGLKFSDPESKSRELRRMREYYGSMSEAVGKGMGAFMALSFHIPQYAFRAHRALDPSITEIGGNFIWDTASYAPVSGSTFRNTSEDLKLIIQKAMTLYGQERTQFLSTVTRRSTGEPLQALLSNQQRSPASKWLRAVLMQPQPPLIDLIGGSILVTKMSGHCRQVVDNDVLSHVPIIGMEACEMRFIPTIDPSWEAIIEVAYGGDVCVTFHSCVWEAKIAANCLFWIYRYMTDDTTFCERYPVTAGEVITPIEGAWVSAFNKFKKIFKRPKRTDTTQSGLYFVNEIGMLSPTHGYPHLRWVKGNRTAVSAVLCSAEGYIVTAPNGSVVEDLSLIAPFNEDLFNNKFTYETSIQSSINKLLMVFLRNVSTKTSVSAEIMLAQKTDLPVSIDPAATLCMIASTDIGVLQLLRGWAKVIIEQLDSEFDAITPDPETDTQEDINEKERIRASCFWIHMRDAWTIILLPFYDPRAEPILPPMGVSTVLGINIGAGDAPCLEYKDGVATLTLVDEVVTADVSMGDDTLETRPKGSVVKFPIKHANLCGGLFRRGLLRPTGLPADQYDISSLVPGVYSIGGENFELLPLQAMDSSVEAIRRLLVSIGRKTDEEATLLIAKYQRDLMLFIIEHPDKEFISPDQYFCQELARVDLS